VRADRRYWRCRGRGSACKDALWTCGGERALETDISAWGYRRFSSEGLHTVGDVDRVQVPFARSQLPSSTFPELRASKADFATSGLASVTCSGYSPKSPSRPVDPFSGTTQCTTDGEMQTTCRVHASEFASCPSSGYQYAPSRMPPVFPAAAFRMPAHLEQVRLVLIHITVSDQSETLGSNMEHVFARLWWSHIRPSTTDR
jgi:hypothetical protein